MANNKPHVIVWLGTTGDQHTPLTYTGNGDLLVGHGPRQFTGAPVHTTIGALRAQHGDPSMAQWLPDDCPAQLQHRDAGGQAPGLCLDTDAPVVMVTVAVSNLARHTISYSN